MRIKDLQGYILANDKVHFDSGLYKLKEHFDSVAFS